MSAIKAGSEDSSFGGTMVAIPYSTEKGRTVMGLDQQWTMISALGISRANLRCLLLLPLAYVAKRSRRHDPQALEVLLTTIAQRANFDAESLDLARGWLRNAPTPEQFELGSSMLRQLARAADEPLISARDLLESVVWASSVAQLDRQRLQRGCGPVSSNARRAMRDLGRWLDVDVGKLWTDVMAELGDELPRSANLRPPRFQTSPDSTRGQLGAPASERDFTTLARGRPALLREPDGPASSIPFPLVHRTGG